MPNIVRKTSTNILLVEDRISDAALICSCLESTASETFHITHAKDMATAIPIIAAKNLHAVMLDLFLSDAHDLEGLISIQAMNPRLPVLILTGREDEKLASLAVQRGAQDYLLKDKINPDMLRRTVRYAVQRKRFEDALTQQAHFDKLTGLANRDLFHQRLSMALSRQQRLRQPVGVMMLDLNGFKAINDTYGHAVGDSLLQEIGWRIPLCLRPYDLAARMGGDEFVVLIEDVKQVSDYMAVASKLISKIEKPVTIRDGAAKVGVSIGIAVCEGDKALTPEVLLQQADEAMYCAKRDGHSSYRVYGDAEERLEVRA